MTKAASFPENELGAVTWVSYVEDQPCRCAEYAVGAMEIGIFKQQHRSTFLLRGSDSKSLVEKVYANPFFDFRR